MPTTERVAHTPAPLTSRGTAVYGAGALIAATPSRLTTAGDTTGHEVALANTRLIAAAPDLLEALKRAREALKANEEITGTWELYQHSPEMKAINAAIAKAEGRS